MYVMSRCWSHVASANDGAVLVGLLMMRLTVDEENVEVEYLLPNPSRRFGIVKSPDPAVMGPLFVVWRERVPIPTSIVDDPER